MDSLICPDCGEETYINPIGKIDRWEWFKCDICDTRHWRYMGGLTDRQLQQIRRGQVYAKMSERKQ